MIDLNWLRALRLPERPVVFEEGPATLIVDSCESEYVVLGLFDLDHLE